MIIEKPHPRPRKAPKRLRRTPLARRSTRIATGKRPRQRRAGPVAAAKRECWRLLSLIVRTLHPICQWCGCARSTDGAHVFGRRHKSVWLVERNILALCRDCADELTDASLTKRTPMQDAYEQLYSPGEYESLAAQAMTPAKFDAVTLVLIRARAHALGIK